MKQRIADFINVIFGFRKFLLVLMVYIIAVVFRINSLIDGSQMVDLVKATTLGFLGANGVEHIMSVVKDHLAAQDNPATPYEDLVDQEAADAKEEGKNG